MEVPLSPYHHGDLANALRDVALDLVRTHGADGFSLRRAAREAGVDPAAVYRHYKDKDGLLLAVAGVGFGLLRGRMRRAQSEAAGPEQRFAALGRTYVGFALDEPRLFRLMFSPRGAGARVQGRAPTACAPGPGEQTSFVMLQQALVELCGPVDESAAISAWAAVHGLAGLLLDQLLSGDPGARAPALIEGLIQMVVRGLRPAAPPAPR